MLDAVLPVGVAAGDATTVAAGADVLRRGGSATDAAIAMTLMACVAETVMTGLAGGGFATHWDPATRTATTVDFFVAVPGIGLDRPVAPMVELEVVFGPQRLDYWAGPASVAVPGVPAGLAELHRRWGRLPWADVVDPAWRAARDGVPISGAQAYVLADVSAAMLLGEDGRAAYAPDGRFLQPGERLHHPGLADALALLRDEGAPAFYTGPIAAALVALMRERGGAVTAADLQAYRVRTAAARAVAFQGCTVHGRTDLFDLLGTLAALPPGLGRMSAAGRVATWVRVLRGPDHPRGTSNVVAVGADGDACVVTTSLGLGSGDWLPGYGLHLNSMLGEGELMRGSHPPGSRVDSMMSPVVATGPDGALALGAGAAGGSRIRSALVQTLTGVLAEGLDPTHAVDRSRIHPVSDRVHAEPGVDEEALQALELAGERVERWPRRAAYFGGVSMVGAGGAAADPRRGGAAVIVAQPAG